MIKPLITSLAVMVAVVFVALVAFSPKSSVPSTSLTAASITVKPAPEAVAPAQRHPLIRVAKPTPKPTITHRVKLVARPTVTPTPTPTITPTPVATPTPTPTPTASSSAPVSLAGAAAAVSFAYAQLGKPYLWGGTGPEAFDCSGLTSAAWAAAGVTIPRTSYAQWADLPHVSTSDLQPGDIVVFSGASHVGLYVGGGYMIHAPHTGTVIEKVALAGYYLANMIGAVRP